MRLSFRKINFCVFNFHNSILQANQLDIQRLFRTIHYNDVKIGVKSDISHDITRYFIEHYKLDKYVSHYNCENIQTLMNEMKVKSCNTLICTDNTEDIKEAKKLDILYNIGVIYGRTSVKCMRDINPSGIIYKTTDLEKHFGYSFITR